MWEMARADSGNETLFSEESSPEVPPSVDTPPRITGSLTEVSFPSLVLLSLPLAFLPSNNRPE